DGFPLFPEADHVKIPLVKIGPHPIRFARRHGDKRLRDLPCREILIEHRAASFWMMLKSTAYYLITSTARTDFPAGRASGFPVHCIEYSHPTEIAGMAVFLPHHAAAGNLDGFADDV